MNNPVAIEALEIGTMPGRFVKPRDGFGFFNGRAMRIPNPIDVYWVTDSLELKVVKAKTEKGLNFKMKNVDGKQLEEIRKYNALFAVAFILDGGEENDKLISVPIMRFYKLERDGRAQYSMDEFEKLAAYTVKGVAYGKIL